MRRFWHRLFGHGSAFTSMTKAEFERGLIVRCPCGYERWGPPRLARFLRPTSGRADE